MKKKKIESIIIATLAFIMLGMSVGFAAYSSKLNIGGTTTVGANKWSVHFDKNSIELQQMKNGESSIVSPEAIGQENSVVKSFSIDDQNNSIKLSLKFDKLNKNKRPYGPETWVTDGDGFGIIANIINDGSFNAKVKDVHIDGFTPEIAKLITLDLSLSPYTSADGYHGSPAISRVSDFPPDDVLYNQTTPFTLAPQKEDGYPYAKLQLALLTKQPDDPKDLPIEDINAEISITIDIEQA